MQAQEKKGAFKRKRKKVEVSNYYVAINIHDALTYYTGKLEWTIDSLRNIEDDPQIRNNLTFLKYTTTNAISRASLHNDPVAAALDTWALTYQMENYFNDEGATSKYGNSTDELANIFVDFRNDYEADYQKYINEKAIGELKAFAESNPIENDLLNRKSVSPNLSEWLGEESLGLKGGLLTVTDLVRDLNNRLEYFAEMLPKQTKWQVEYELGEFMTEDSLGIFLDNISNTLMETSQFLGNTESLINYNRDTLLANIEYQRLATLYAIRQERIETMETLAEEREIIMEALQNERLAVQDFASGERAILMADVEELSGRLIDQSTTIGKELIDYIFFKVIILLVIVGLFFVGGVVLWKKL
ncbi:MAG TPA: hypothetical protein DDY13_18990 [Cytophagales bacterium]|nr:hypothetical protein [Cytophagales bacterium]